HALLDAPARALALDLLGPRPLVGHELVMGDPADVVGIADGELCVRYQQTAFPRRTSTPAEALERTLALAERLVDDRLEERLAAVARTDALPAVRLAALTTLRDQLPRHPATRPALEAACLDDDGAGRLFAAAALGAVRGGGEALASLASRGDVPDDVSA